MDDLLKPDNILKVAPTIFGTIFSAIITLSIFYFGWRRERRKLSLDLYKEFYSEDFAKKRYKAQEFIDQHIDIDWREADPYKLYDPDENLAGYAAVTRFFTRLAILYKEKQLDRKLVQRLLSQESGYWYGLIFERLIFRENMYTRYDLFYIFDKIRNGVRPSDFEDGYKKGIMRHKKLINAPPDLWKTFKKHRK